MKTLSTNAINENKFPYRQISCTVEIRIKISKNLKYVGRQCSIPSLWKLKWRSTSKIFLIKLFFLWEKGRQQIGLLYMNVWSDSLFYVFLFQEHSTHKSR